MSKSKEEIQASWANLLRSLLKDRPNYIDRVLSAERDADYTQILQDIDRMDYYAFYSNFRMSRDLFSSILAAILPLIERFSLFGGRKPILPKLQLAITLLKGMKGMKIISQKEQT